tara:strand:- start:23106 stop:24176 length:1071 start_codon:yes stop_codon:yes gene_type:complete
MTKVQNVGILFGSRVKFFCREGDYAVIHQYWDFYRIRILMIWFVVSVFLPLGDHAFAAERQEINLNDIIGIEQLNRLIEDKKTDHKVFYFGFDLRSGPLEDARQYLPFLDYLSRATGLKLKLKFTSKDSSIIEDVGLGRVHFAAIGAVSYVRAKERYAVQAIARGVNKLGKAEYQSAIVVASNSPIQSLDEIRGKRFAFGSLTSTQGHLIPRIALKKRGISLEDLSAFEYTGSHRNCANAVVTGRADACGMQDTMAKNLSQKGQVRILYLSDYYPSSGIAANKDVPKEIIDKIRRALVDFDPLGRDKKALYHWNNTEMPNGFRASTGHDYIELQNWLVNLGIIGGEGKARNGALSQ